MADVMEHVAYLSQEIGPRPAGTEEEQQAALYITEHMQKEAGLSAVIEDFTGVSNNELPRAICSAVTVVFSILALALPVVALPAAIIAILSAAVYVAEAFGKPILFRVLSRGVSQNVVAKYEPGYSPESGNSRRRKIILVAHYDSGKARPELKGPIVKALPIIKWVVLGAFVATALLLLLGGTVLSHASGAVDIVLTVFTIVFVMISALPLVQFILGKASSYNDGANCNASGVAVLMEAAARVGRGRTDMSSVDEGASPATIHGERAARDEGLIPEGAEVSYTAPTTQADENASPVERLAAAKAAVAALSGKPVSDFMSEEILSASVPVNMPASSAGEGRPAAAGETLTAEEVQQMAAGAEVSVAAAVEPQRIAGAQASESQPAAQQAAAEEDSGQSGLPAWFIEAQKKAKRPAADNKPVQRSRYADALEAAVSESSVHFEEANNAVFAEARQRMQSMNDGIFEVKAPESAWLQAHPGAQPQQDAPVAQDAANQSIPSASSQSAPQDALSAPAMQSVPSEPAPASAQIPSQPSQATPLQMGSPASAPILPEDLSVPDLADQGDVPLPSFLSQQPQASAVDPSAERVAVSADGLPAENAPASAPASAVPAADPDKTIAAAPVFVDAVTAATDPSLSAEFEAISLDNPTQAHPPIVLPSIGGSEMPAVQVEDLKQRAPLADRHASDGHSGKGRLNIPSIDPAHPAAQEAARRGLSAAELRSSLPSLSGMFAPVDKEPEAPSTVSLTGSFAPIGATSSSDRVGDELLEDVDPEDIYVDDADDSAYEDSYTDAGAFAGPGYVEMPKSRVRRLFDRFRHKNSEEESTPQEWLHVDDSFEARSVGAARGGWESFREDQGGQGANRQDRVPEQSTPYGDAYADEAFDDYDDADDYGYGDDEKRGNRSWYGGAFSRVKMGRVDMRSGKEGEPPLEGEDPEVPQPEAPEMQKIYQFRNPDINTEVWFVALGAELGGHSGINAFIAEHEHELRGSIIIELEALGAGDLCMIEGEGGYRVAKTSSRMKRYTRKASQASGVSIGSASMLWKSGVSSFAINHGLQAMHLVGMDGGKPAFFGDREDILDNVDEGLLRERVDFVMELLKSI